MEIKAFAERIPNFSALPDNTQIVLLIWHMQEFGNFRRVLAPGVKSGFEALDLRLPSNIHQSLRRLTQGKSAPLLFDSSGYYLERSFREKLEADFGKYVKTPQIEVVDTVLPASVVKGTRLYLEKIVWQINGCYQMGFFDGCTVLMRRLIESLLIDVFIHANKEMEIKTGGEFMMLQGIIAVAKSKKHVHLPRGSDEILELVKLVGDRAAHNRAYITTAKDIDEIVPKFRTLISDLLNAANIHPK